MTKELLNYMNTFLTRFRTKRGFGVHSPFAFYFITEVLSCKYCYYPFLELDEKAEILNNSFHLNSKDYYHLLFRLSNYFKPSRIFSTGSNEFSILSSLYLTAFNSNIEAYILDDSLNSDIVNKFSGVSFFDRLIIPQFEDSSFIIEEFMNIFDVIDILYLTKENKFISDTWNFLLSCFPKFHNNSLLIVEDISSSDDVSLIWKKLCEASNVAITFDMKDFGIVLFSDKLNKKNYKLYL